MSIHILAARKLMQHVRTVYLEGEDFSVSEDDHDAKNILNFTSCDHRRDLILNIEDDTEFEDRENIVVALVDVTLIRLLENGSYLALNLSEEEKRRLVWNFANTTVTILDDDGMFIYHNIARRSFQSTCAYCENGKKPYALKSYMR